MFLQLQNPKNFLTNFILLIKLSIGAMALFSTVECPADIDLEISSPDTWSSLQTYHTLHFVCSNLHFNPGQLVYPNEEIYQQDFFGSQPRCELKFKVTASDNPSTKEALVACPISQNLEDRVLLAHPHNCSLFYKCNWSTAVLFECPEDLHFNSDLQICDWPWQAGCDHTWTGCPRPRPICPSRPSRPLYLPHPHLCDQFYQCNWGRAYLQSCPTGLHFNPNLEVCDWPHNAKCHIC